MKITRTVTWEYSREYNSLEEAKADEDNFLRDTMCEGAELYSNELTDESGNFVEDEDE